MPKSGNKSVRKAVHGEDKIVVKGARTHNLKNITVEMPRNKMIVFTGPGIFLKRSFGNGLLFRNFMIEIFCLLA